MLVDAQGATGEVDVDLLDLLVFVEAEGTQLAAHAALLVAAPRRFAVGRVVGVDPGDARAQRLDDPHRPGDVAGPDRAGQSVDRVVGDGYGLGFGLEWDDDEHRPEDLLLGHPHPVVDVDEDGRLVVVAAALQPMAAGGQLGALLQADLDVALDRVELLLGDQRSHLARLFGRRSDADRHGARDEFADEAVVDGTLHEQPGTGRTDLARAGEDADQRAVDSGFEVGVFEDDVRALAAQLQADLLHVPGAGPHDGLADLDAAREGDHVDVARRSEVVAHLTARTGEHLEDALRQAGLFEDVAELERGERRDRGGLQDHHVAGGERRRHLPGRHQQREVPRRDAGRDADRLPHDHAHALAGDLQCLAVLFDGKTGVVVEGVRRVVYVDERLGEQLAHLPGLEQRQVLGALADQAGRLVEQLGALHGELARPGTGIERLARRAYRTLSVCDGALRHDRDRLFGRRIDDLVGKTTRGGDPLAVDKHLVGLELLDR